jgi:hypothetical protein
MGSQHDGVVGKVKNTIGLVLGGGSGQVPRADEDPDIEYPEPLDQEYIDDGRLILINRSDQAEQNSGGGQGTEDAADAGRPTE